ncbi:galectin-3-binding protein A-like [Engraulis encrasicolus]|uniref:galectin-3-binding protein A-like n=1 Tax=Engraulis encrasicolus TaxID=184585 RepID=UPI002FD2C7E2
MSTSRGVLFGLVLVFCLLFSELESRSLDWLDIGRRPVQEGDVRLEEGKGPSEGRVEVFHDGSWGTVCDDNWGMEEARVVCAQLGFRGALSAEAGGKFPAGSGSIWLDDLECKGSENSLSSCTFKGWGVTDCSHAEDAGVLCDIGEPPNNTQTQYPALNISKSYSMDHSIELSDQMGELFDSGTGCDVTLTFAYPADDSLELQTQEGQGPDENINEEKICVHSLVLSLFPKMVISNSSNDIKIGSNCQHYVRDFVRYLYTRKITVTSGSMQCLHQLASGFGTERLVEDIGRLFVPLLPEDSSFRTQVALFKYAGRAGDNQLRENVLRYLGWNMEPLVSSAQWKNAPQALVKGLLVRSDLVVPDEAWLLGALDAWMLEQGETLKPEHQAALLGHLRFPMMTPEKLHELPFTSRLYSSHKDLFQNVILLGFQFHALDFSTLTRHMDNQSEQLQPRIYTASPWSVSFNITKSYGTCNIYNRNGDCYKSLSTPVPLSSSYSSRNLPWTAEIFQSENEQGCNDYNSNDCKYFSGRLLINVHLGEHEGKFKFSNQLLMTCGENYVFHVQEFKNNEASFTKNSMAIPIPCPDDLTYRFVVRPQYT